MPAVSPPESHHRSAWTWIRPLGMSVSVAALGSLSWAVGAPPTERVPTPIPATGAVPPIAAADPRLSDEVIAPKGRSSDDRTALKALRRSHFGDMRNPERRAEGIAKLAGFTSSSSMVPMYEELRGERDDVLLGMLDHFRRQGSAGQAALAWIAINDQESRIRNEATQRIDRPADPAVLGVLDASLRSNTHMVANRAASLASVIGAVETIPLLIFSQATEDRAENTGDLAWIAIGTAKAYTANIVPVLGGNSGAFQPVVGVVYEGVLLRVMDAVVVSYRTEVHNALVNLTTADWGQPTDQFGYDMRRWWTWYNDEYVPFRAARAEKIARAAKADEIRQGGGALDE